MVWDPATEAKITDFLSILRAAGLRFEYTIVRAPDATSQPLGADETAPALTLAASPDPANVSLHVPAVPQLEVDFTGPDAPLMTERGGELLHAMESLAAGILRLEPDENDQLSFNALGFKQARQAATERTAQQGIDAVRATGKPFVYPPMNSRERRMLHLVLATSGLPTASSGEGPRRFVVVYPLGMTPTPEQFTPPPARRPGPFRGPSNPGRGSHPGRGGHLGFGRRPGDNSGGRFAPPPDRPAPPAPPRLDPNGNPLEQIISPEAAAATSEEERLASLRRAFRKR